MPPLDDSALQALYAQRWADPAAQTALEHITTDVDLRRLACRRMADSILYAHSLAPDRWGLSIPDAGGIRLNLGRPEAVFMARDGLRLLFDLPAAKRTGHARLLRILGATPKGIYRTVPDSAYVTLRWDMEYRAFGESVEQLRDAHEHHLAAAARTSTNAMTRAAHHPGLIAAVAGAADISLPQPSFVGPIPPLDMVAAETEMSDAALLSREEGGRRDVLLSRVERDPRLRELCIAKFGAKCQACRIDLGKAYGPVAEGLIHVHHLHPAAKGPRDTHPIRDLRPVCANCHMVIHAGGALRTVEEVRALFEAHKAGADV